MRDISKTIRQRGTMVTKPLVSRHFRITVFEPNFCATKYVYACLIAEVILVGEFFGLKVNGKVIFGNSRGKLRSAFLSRLCMLFVRNKRI